MREALAEHLAASGLPPDAGDSDPFAVVRIFCLPYPIPNTRARKARGPNTRPEPPGERLPDGPDRRARDQRLGTSQWGLPGLCSSLGTRSCRSAWRADCCAEAHGYAFLAGRRQQNLYGFEYEELLNLTVDDARQLASKPLPARMRRGSAGLNLAVLVVLSLPAAIGMAIAWYALVPAWLLNRAFGQAGPATKVTAGPGER